MKNLMKRIRMRRAVSKRNSKSIDPIKAYKARLEIAIYTWLVDAIEKELETEDSVRAQDEATVTETMAAPAPLAAIAQAGVQTA